MTDEPKPEAKPPELTSSVKLRGRIEADAVMASQSSASKLLIGDLQNGYGFRRVRIGATGKVGSSAEWVAEIDVAGGDVRLQNAFVGLTALPGVRQVNIGHFREPFSLEGATSSPFLTFMERSTLNKLDPSRNWGVAGYWWPKHERMTFALGTFRDGTDNGGVSTGDDDNWAVTTRWTGLPIYQDEDGQFELVHVGAAFSHRLPVDGVVRYNSDPESNLLVVPDNPPSPFLPQVNVPASGQQLYNLQGAWVRGPLSVQSEWFATSIEQRNAGIVFLHGFYVNTACFLTGEHKGYNKQRAGFTRVAVRKPLIKSDDDEVTGLGAVELAARFSFTDYGSSNLPVSPTTTPSGPPTATLLYETTFGVNWYLNDYTRLMANYTLSVPDAHGFPALPVHVFGLRASVYW